ncbi:MAG TPA: type II toxin-antitoxin system VapB family antitoxin [Thermoanaerobaculia bacterium]|nr:type II toxin-antitoxin system VapB family antitoxin [Thermoanaerobaculia bacterium]
MRTNIHLDDDLLARCMRCTGLKTKRAVVEEGLRALLRLDGQREVRDLRGRLRWEDRATPAAPSAPRPGSGDADPR